MPILATERRCANVAIRRLPITDRTRQRGFTLLEILLVVVVIGVMAGLAILSIGGNDSRYLLQEVQRLQGIMQLAQDEASFLQRNLGMRLTNQGYEFLRYDDATSNWTLLQDEPFQPHSYQVPLQVDLQLEGSTLVLEGKQEKMQPQLLFLASGENSAFILALALAEKSEIERFLFSDGFSPVEVRTSLDDND